MDCSLVRAADHAAFNAPVLVSQSDLQMEDPFPVALETEMPRLDDPGVDGSHRHLVDLFSFHAVKIISAFRRPDRLHPGMAFGDDAALLVDLPLEQMGGGAFGR